LTFPNAEFCHNFYSVFIFFTCIFWIVYHKGMVAPFCRCSSFLHLDLCCFGWKFEAVRKYYFFGYVCVRFGSPRRVCASDCYAQKLLHTLE
jgi:hypothetical protein